MCSYIRCLSAILINSGENILHRSLVDGSSPFVCMMVHEIDLHRLHYPMANAPYPRNRIFLFWAENILFSYIVYPSSLKMYTRNFEQNI